MKWNNKPIVVPQMNSILDKPDTSPPKGLVDPAGAAKRIRLATFAPSAPLLPLVEYFWLVEWDLTGQPPQTQRVLPYPNAHMVFELGRTAIHGVVRGAFVRKLEGAGRVLGVRFRPGGLRGLIQQPMTRLTDRTMPLDDVLRVSTAQAEVSVLSARSDLEMVAAAESLLLAARPVPDPRAALAEQAVLAAAATNGPLSTGALAIQVDMEERSLQRLFSNYVGVSPKWVIQRFRLQEATSRLATPGPVALAALAAELGFFDQAHLTRSFTALVGMAPLAYWKTQQAASS